MSENPIVDVARGYVKQGVAAAKDAAGEVQEKARVKFDDLRDDVKSAGDELARNYGFDWQNVTQWVKKNPGVGLAGAMLTGVALGFLLRRGD